MSGHPCFASLARLPDRSTPCRPASAEASNPLLAPRPIPSGIGMTKPTIQQARDRAEVVSGATRSERVTSAGSLECLLTGARNGLSNVCSRSGVRIAHSLVEPRERVDFSRSDANDWMATSGTSRKIRSGSHMSASLIGRLGSSTVRLSTTIAVSMSLTGSCFSSESAPGPFQYGIRERGGTISSAALPPYRQ